MAKVKIELNRAGVGEFLNSQQMVDVVRHYTDAVSARATCDTVSTVQPGRRRVHGRVETDGRAAYQENLRTNALLRATYGGG